MLPDFNNKSETEYVHLDRITGPKPRVENLTAEVRQLALDLETGVKSDPVLPVDANFRVVIIGDKGQKALELWWALVFIAQSAVKISIVPLTTAGLRDNAEAVRRLGTRGPTFLDEPADPEEDEEPYPEEDEEDAP